MGVQEPPFKNPKLMPLSPVRGNMFSPPMSPTGSLLDSFSPRTFSAARPRCARPACTHAWPGSLGRLTSPIGADPVHAIRDWLICEARRQENSTRLASLRLVAGWQGRGLEWSGRPACGWACRRRRNSADMYLAEAAGRSLSPTGALSPDRPRSPVFAAGQGAGGGGGFHSSQVMGLEGLMYGSPTYVRPPRWPPSHPNPAVPAMWEVAGRKAWWTGGICPPGPPPCSKIPLLHNQHVWAGPSAAHRRRVVSARCV